MNSNYLIFFSVLLVFFACTEQDIVPASQVITQPEMHALNAQSEKITFSGNNYNFSYEVIDGTNIFEGDIIISEKELQEMKLAANSMERGAYHSHTKKRWKNNIVPYIIADRSLNTRVIAAMNTIEAATNIDFRIRNPHSNVHKNYIRFVVGNGCSSAVGMQGGLQEINLSAGCTTGAAIHEICHALGMWHEQTRNDRDDHIIIHEENIQDDREHNFDQNNCTVDSGNFDFDSIMMYGPCAFTNACPAGTGCGCTAARATITRLDGTLYTVRTTGLSTGDIAAINEMYPPHWCTNTPCCGVICNDGYVCINGDCIIDINNPPDCINDNDCPRYHSCAGGECVPW